MNLKLHLPVILHQHLEVQICQVEQNSVSLPPPEVSSTPTATFRAVRFYLPVQLRLAALHPREAGIVPTSDQHLSLTKQFQPACTARVDRHNPCPAVYSPQHLHHERSSFTQLQGKYLLFILAECIATFNVSLSLLPSLPNLQVDRR